MKPPSFPMYVNNWLASSRIASMTPAQEGGYIRLLCYAWNSDDGGLPDDDAELSALSRLNGQWDTLGAKVKACFHKAENGRLYSERLSSCLKEAVDYRKQQTDLANRRWHKHGKTKAMPRHMPRQCSESESESESYSDTEFDTFWSKYPKKKGKKAALKAWGKATDKPKIEVILKAIDEQKRSKDWNKEHGQFIPEPATWINNGRWDDVVEVDSDFPQQEILRGCL